MYELIILIGLAFGILQIILFFKVWTEGGILFIAENGKTLAQVQYSVKGDTFVIKEDVRREVIEEFEDMGDKIKVNKEVLVTVMKAK